MALLVTAGVGFLQAAILFGRKAPLLVSLYANSGVETRLAVYGFLANFGARRFPKGERKALWCARRRIPLAPVGGLTRRLRREWWGCRPEWGSTFFRSERKYQRKHAARRLREKALYCPFLKEGVRNVARKLVGELTQAIVRARAHSFPLSKRARLFPSAAYRRSAPPQSAWGRLTPCGVTWFLQLDCFAASTKEGL